MKVIHLSVTGRVQGVGYRAFVEREAKARGLEGWVRNRRDGSVEAVVAGEADKIDALIAACRNGPPASQVENIEQKDAGHGELDSRNAGERFSVLPTT
ncbi:MAG: acylphosphatase [Xanthobacteraceae bacterium]|nr:acylphosphatase [Xanthobacteraceae bacterium]QYK43847.1 MAG: acylphosphatase [Xanthobacteraceae bacterium]